MGKPVHAVERFLGIDQLSSIMIRVCTYLVVIGLFVSALGAGKLCAQATAAGTIQGTVVDNSQAVVMGAEVVVTNKANGATRTTTTNSTGNYRFDFMPAASYTITITKQGFAKIVESTELLVVATDSVNVTIKAGATTEVVEVSGEAPVVDVAKTGVSQNITPSEIEQLPMLGRDVANLAYLAPGVKAGDAYDPTKSRYSILSVNGQSGRNVNVTINGVDNKDNTVGGPVMQMPLEAVQEFNISTQRFSAANGRSEGAAINLITKSGSNGYHGSAFGFFRDQVLNSENYFEEQPGGEKGPYSRQFFGGSVGGPFVKDKMFGFFAFERQREHTSLTENPFAFQQLSLVTSLGAQPATSIPTPFFENRYNGRLDYRFSDRETAYLSYTSQANNDLNDQSSQNGDLTEGNFTVNHLQIANLTLNSVLSNTLINNFTFGFQYWNNLIDSKTRTPFVTFIGGESFGTNVNVPQQSYQRKFQFRDDITKTYRNHTFQWGIDYIFNPRLGGFFESNSTLEIDFGADPSDIIGNTGGAYPQSFASPGAAISMSASSGAPSFDMPGGTKQLGLYFQDDWKVNRHLMLNLGLRWDKDYNLIGATAIKNSRTFEELTAIGSPYAALPHDDNKDFSPRFGFAYDLTGAGKHVLRGGYGLYFGNVFQNIPLFMIQQANPTIYQQVFAITNTTDEVPGTGITLGNWRYGVDPLPTIPPALAQLTDGSTGRLMDPKYRNPVSEQFNFGYQWAVSPSSVVEVEYIHELGLHEEKTLNINPKDPNNGGARPLSAAFAAAGVPVLGRVMDEVSANRSRYDGLNFSFRQRMTKHFSLNANYSLSRAMGWAVASGFPNVPSNFRNYPHNPNNPWDPLDFGPTLQDERHHITISGITNLPWGFQVSPILQFGSARPFDLNEGYDVLGLGSGYSRPLIVQDSDPKNYGVFANSSDAAAAQACLAAGQCRQVGYDTVPGRAFFQLDTRISTRNDPDWTGSSACCLQREDRSRLWHRLVVGQENQLIAIGILSCRPSFPRRWVEVHASSGWQLYLPPGRRRARAYHRRRAGLVSVLERAVP
jgi:outer membrane receptor protein involved in Fe transport